MAVWDGVVLALLLVSICVGAWRGLVFELLSLVGWGVAFFVARLIAPEAALRLQGWGLDEMLAYGLGFVGTFVVLAFAWGLVSALAKKLIDASGLRPVDRTLGAGFGLLRALLLLLVASVVIVSTPLGQSDWWLQSQSAEWLNGALGYVLPALPQELGRLLPS